MKNLHLLSATEAVSKIKDKKISSRELVIDCFDQIKKTDPNIHAWAHLDKVLALDQAAAIDKKIAIGRNVGFLAGVPVGVKDIFNTIDFPTEMGSPIWKNFTSGMTPGLSHI